MYLLRGEDGKPDLRVKYAGTASCALVHRVVIKVSFDVRDTHKLKEYDFMTSRKRKRHEKHMRNGIFPLKTELRWHAYRDHPEQIDTAHGNAMLEGISLRSANILIWINSYNPTNRYPRPCYPTILGPKVLPGQMKPCRVQEY